MAPSKIIVIINFFYISTFFPHNLQLSIASSCPTKRCRRYGPQLRFPFHIANPHDKDDSCHGYAGFDLSCDEYRADAILDLPSLGKFVVDAIDYKRQYVMLQDPGDCLANWLTNLEAFSGDLNSTLSLSSPFSVEVYGNLTLANCSRDAGSTLQMLTWAIGRVDCLSSTNRSVVVAHGEDSYARLMLTQLGCHTWTVLVPAMFSNRNRANVSEGMWLKWDQPDCRSCEAGNGRCQPGGSTGLEVKCKHGLSKSAEVGIIIAAVVPFILFISGATYYLSTRATRRRETQGTGENGVTDVELIAITSCPQTRIDDLGQLPRPDDNTCAICLAEYRPEEMLRTIPACEHYFHASCLAEWLTRNGSCPLCRNKRGSTD